MKEPVFTISGVLKEAYGIIKPKFWTVVGQYFLLFVIYIALSVPFQHIFIVHLLLVILYMFTMTLFALSYMRKGSFSLEDISNTLTLKKFCYLGFAAILFVLAVTGGLILLVVPGIIFGISMYLFKYLTIEKDITPIQSLKASIRITRGYRWKIFCASLVFILIILLGVICLVVGLFFAVPLIMIADALIYKKLSERARSETVEGSPETVEVIEAVIVETPEAA